MPTLAIELRTALLLQQEGRLQEAEAQCRQLLAKDPDHAEGQYRLGMLLLEQNAGEEALGAFQQALRFAPNNGDYWIGFTQALLKLDRPREALQIITDLIDKGLDWPAALALRERAQEAVQHAISQPTTPITTAKPHGAHWVLTLDDDLRIHVPSNIQCMTTYVLLEQEDWCEPERAFLARLIEPGMNILDVGASYGIYALTLAKCLQGQGRVLAVGSDHGTANLLEASIADNDLDKVLSLRRAVPAEMTTLDALIKDPVWPANAQIDLVKLDLSGHEAQALEEAHEWLDQQDPIILINAQTAQTSETRLRQQLNAQGYQWYRLIPGLNALLPLEPNDMLNADGAKIFACKSSRAAQLERAGHLSATSLAHHHAVSAKRHWREALAQLPYVQAINAPGQGMTAWQTLEPSIDPHWPDYELALNNYLSATDPSYSLSERVNWLALGLNKLEQLYQDGDKHLATDLLYIRVLSAAGDFAQANKIAKNLLKTLDNSPLFSLDRPFLPPLADYDQRAPIDDLANWLDAGIRETVERFGSRLTAFHTTDSSALTQLQELVDNPNVSSLIHRRFVLHNLPDQRFSLRPLSITLTEMASDEITGQRLNIPKLMGKSLDLGSGSQPKNPFNAKNVMGIDLGAENLAAPERSQGADYEVLQHDLILEPLPFCDDEFDYVTAFDFLEHVPRLIYTPERRTPFVDLMNEIYRVLKPEGIFLSVTPAFPQPAAFQDPTHVNIITEDTFRLYFDHINCWARIYGFNGAFRIVSQQWQGSHLVTHMVKHQRTVK